jgi:hypothetical protein
VLIAENEGELWSFSGLHGILPNGHKRFDFWWTWGGLPCWALRAPFTLPFSKGLASTFCQPSGCRKNALHDSLCESSSLQCSLFTGRAPQ